MLGASDVPSLSQALIGAALAAVVGFVAVALAKVLARMIAKTLRDEVAQIAQAAAGQSPAVVANTKAVHDLTVTVTALSAQVTAVVARDASAHVQQLTRIADAIARSRSPRRASDPPDADFLDVRALPPSEAAGL